MNLVSQQTPEAAIAKEGEQKGLHILSNFKSPLPHHLGKHELFKAFVDKQIDELKLTKIGEVFHDFPGGGFTAVVCLAESHLSIHTWPDDDYATFDVYLSNHMRDNSDKAKLIYSSVLRFFEADVLFENLINR